MNPKPLIARGAHPERPARRLLLRRAIGSVGGIAVLAAPPRISWSADKPTSVQEQIIEFKVREFPKVFPGENFDTFKQGRIKIELPPVADSGLSVNCVVTVESPMTPDDYVKTLWMWALRNPRPIIIKAEFTPAMPNARWETRLRLGESQRILGIAEMSSGERYTDGTDVIVLASACQDGSG
jgi:sulfur-oxidizing protein SoxY